MTFLERWLVYPAPPPDDGDWRPEHIASEDVTFTSADGTRLHGWFFERPGASRAVLYCHGNGEHVAYNADLMDLIRRKLDASVFIFDYRGYGRSEGVPHEKGIIADGLAAAGWLAERTGARPDDLILMGRSLGGAVCVAIAERQGARCLVLQSTFTRLTDVAAHHFPILPVRLVMRNRYDSLKRIAGYDGPVFASHSVDDEIVPFKLGRRLFETAPTSEKEFVSMQVGGHNYPQPREYWAELEAFLERVEAARARVPTDR